jgi:FKBP-type peptidyl-prolyl cis-trans isomerase
MKNAINIKIFGIVGLLLLVAVSFSCKKFLNPSSNADVIKNELKKNEEAIAAYIKKNDLKTTLLGDGVHIIKTTSVANARQAKLGDLLSLHYVFYKLDGTKVDSSLVLQNKPIQIPFGLTETNILQVAGSTMLLGEKATYLVPFLYAFGDKDVGVVPAYSPMKVDISLVKIQNEDEQVAAYMTENKYTPTATGSGLLYHVVNPLPNGDQLKDGQTVQLKYTGKLLYYSTLLDKDGKRTNVFDSGTFSFTLGSGSVVKGFEEGVKKLKVGEKGIICFPSSLGYGDTGSKNQSGQYTILPKAPLLFEVEVLSSK